MKLEIEVAGKKHLAFASEVCSMMEEAAKIRGTGIAKRTPEYLIEKMKEGKAIIALSEVTVVGFCYIETWGHEKYVANSGLIVHPEFRHSGLAKKIKEKAFELSRSKFPNAKIFGITTSLAVMKINSDLGYKPVTFSELTTDEAFWQGCQSCKNYDILTRTEKSHCLCTGMLYKPEEKKPGQLEEIKPSVNKVKRWETFRRFIKLQRLKAKRKILSSFGITDKIKTQPTTFV